MKNTTVWAPVACGLPTAAEVWGVVTTSLPGSRVESHTGHSRLRLQDAVESSAVAGIATPTTGLVPVAGVVAAARRQDIRPIDPMFAQRKHVFIAPYWSSSGTTVWRHPV